MADIFYGDFAKLVPRNHVAQLLFSETLLYVEKNDTFHLKFMNRTGSESVTTSDEPVESSTDYDSHPGTDADDSQSKVIQNIGHFVLSFDAERAPEMPHLGWRVGRGSGKLPNRGVDLMLAKPGANKGKSLAYIHLVFRFNRRSGFLMLRAGSEKVPVEYKLNGVWKTLTYRQEQLMYQLSTTLRAGACEYELEYTIEKKHREAYFKRRNAFLEIVAPSQETLFEKLPGDSCILRGTYLEFQTQGSGAFGWINQAVDTKTGDPVAIKELRITSRGTRREAVEEVKLGRRFLVGRISECSYRHLTVNRIREVFFLFWTLHVSMAMPTVAATWKSSTYSCLSHNLILQLSSGQIQISLERLSCTG